MYGSLRAVALTVTASPTTPSVVVPAGEGPLQGRGVADRAVGVDGEVGHALARGPLDEVRAGQQVERERRDVGLVGVVVEGDVQVAQGGGVDGDRRATTPRVLVPWPVRMPCNDAA